MRPLTLMGHGRTVERRGRVPGKALKETVVLKDLLNRLNVLAGHGLHRRGMVGLSKMPIRFIAVLKAPTPPA